MKKFKKIFAAIAASALVAAMSFTSMAATNATNITINGRVPNTAEKVTTTYNYYQVLKATVADGHAAYYVTDEGLSRKIAGLKDSTTGNALFKVTKTADGSRFNVVPTRTYTEADGIMIANALKTIIDDTTIDDDVISKGEVTVTSGDSVKIEVPGDGYYLFVSSLGTKLVVDTASGDCTIYEKNDYPSSTKKVKNSKVTVGEDATYYIIVKVPVTVNASITVHDTLDNELKFNQNSVAVHIDETNAITDSTDVAELSSKNYSELTGTGITASSEVNGHCSFEITIPAAQAGKTLVFKYSAKLSGIDNENPNGPYNNTEYITYAGYESEHKIVPISTCDFDLTKKFEDNNDVALNAKFKLYKANAEGKLDINDSSVMVVDKIGNSENKYVVNKAGSKNTEITAFNTKKLNVIGLGEGTYYLVETSTEKGYNLLADSIRIDVNGEGNVSHKKGTEETINNNNVEVLNNKGLLLPSTGGMGTTVFAIVGLLVMAGAAVTLIVKKRA